MTIVDYTTLQAAAQAWANRIDSSTSARVQDFIRLAEDRIWITSPTGVVRSQLGITQATLTIPAGQNWVALPADWLQFERIKLPGGASAQVSGSNKVEYMPPALLEDLDPQGDPNAYTIEGGRLIYGVTQDPAGSGQALDCKYHAHPGNLGVAGLTTTWLLLKAPSIYLYATLLEFSIFVKKADRVAEFGTLLERAIDGFKSVDRAGQQAGSAWRYRRA